MQLRHPCLANGAALPGLIPFASKTLELEQLQTRFREYTNDGELASILPRLARARPVSLSDILHSLMQSFARGAVAGEEARRLLPLFAEGSRENSRLYGAAVGHSVGAPGVPIEEFRRWLLEAAAALPADAA